MYEKTDVNVKLGTNIGEHLHIWHERVGKKYKQVAQLSIAFEIETKTCQSPSSILGDLRVP